MVVKYNTLEVSSVHYEKQHGIICPSNEELLKVILYAHEQLSFDSNAKILRATLEYIHISKRFE